MTAITDIIGREILDSRGNPTVEVDVILEDGSLGRAAVPSGASTGAHEAVELRDGDKARYRRQGRAQGGRRGQRRNLRRARRHGGRGAGQDRRDADRARRHAQQRPPRRQCHSRRVARRRQGRGRSPSAMPLYRYVGGTAARLLPVPMMNIVNGGVHADNPIDFQEFMIMPVGAPSFAEALRMGVGNFPYAEEGSCKRCRPQHQCRRRGRLCAEPEIGRSRARLRHAGDREGRLQAGRGRRARARSGGERILQGRQIRLRRRRQDPLAATSRRNISPSLSRNYPIVSIEDGMAEDDWDGWKILTDLIGGKCQLVGDDLFVTNVTRLARRHQAKASAIRSWSRSTRSARSPRRWRPSRWRTRPATPR